MKTAKQLIKEYIDKGSNMPIEGMALLTKFECELLMEQYAQEVVKNNFVLAPVSGSLLSFEQCLREEFLINTQNYPKEYHQLFKQNFERAEKRFKEQSGNDR